MTNVNQLGVNQRVNIIQLPPPPVQPLDRWKWLNEVASADSLTPTARLVAHTLALHMKADLTDCYPSQPLITRKSGLCERSVRNGLKTLIDSGYLLVDKQRTEGRVWCKSVYVPTLPVTAVTQRNSTSLNSADDRQQMPVVPATDAGTGGTTCREYRHQLPTNQTPNQKLKQNLNRISRKQERLIESLRGQEKKEKSQEVLREKSQENLRKILKAASHIGISEMPLGSARLPWLAEIRSLTALPHDQIIALMESNK